MQVRSPRGTGVVASRVAGGERCGPHPMCPHKVDTTARPSNVDRGARGPTRLDAIDDDGSLVEELLATALSEEESRMLSTQIGDEL